MQVEVLYLADAYAPRGMWCVADNKRSQFTNAFCAVFARMIP